MRWFTDSTHQHLRSIETLATIVISQMAFVLQVGKAGCQVPNCYVNWVIAGRRPLMTASFNVPPPKLMHACFIVLWEKARPSANRNGACACCLPKMVQQASCTR